MKVSVGINLFKEFWSQFSGLNESRFVNELSLWANIFVVIFRQQLRECDCFHKKGETGKGEKIHWRERKDSFILNYLNNHCLVFIVVVDVIFFLVNWQHYSSLDVPHNRTSQMMLVVRNLPARAGDVRHVGSIPGSGRPSGGGHGNPLQCSCLDNPVDRGAWWAALHRVAKSWTRLK